MDKIFVRKKQLKKEICGIMTHYPTRKLFTSIKPGFTFVLEKGGVEKAMKLKRNKKYLIKEKWNG